MFSIIIPTWNNLSYIKLCVASIKKNSLLNNQIILHINDGSDGTLQWAKNEKLTFSCSSQNIGICIAVNTAAALATNTYIIYLNDDMYCCPSWDKFLLDEIEKIGHDNFMISATMIEPNDTGNTAVIVADFGKTADTFDEIKLLKNLPLLNKSDWSGSSWPPLVISKQNWQTIGGFSIEFSPGMASDDDFAMKMWSIGCRYFKGVGKSKVYHFQTKSTTRIKKNNGRKQFVLKWNISASFFNTFYLKKGEPFTGLLIPPNNKLVKKNKLKIWFKKKFIY